VILAFAELAPRYGLLEYFREETEKINAKKEVGSAPAACPKCGNAFLALYGYSWRCNQCGATGVVEGALVPQCPKCQSIAVVHIGSGRRCNQCGLQFGNAPPISSPLTRGEALRIADAQGVFGGRR
jgi:ribosomal protein L37AE/L43A